MKHTFSAVLRLIFKLGAEFSLGGGLYFAIESVFRLLRHHSPPLPHVFFLGGGAFLFGILLCRLPFPRRIQLLVLPLLGFGLLTAYEYFFGLYFLTRHGLRIWDYTGCPHEFRGLICLKFSLCWGALMWLILAIDTLTERLLARTPFSFSHIFEKKTKRSC